MILPTDYDKLFVSAMDGKLVKLKTKRRYREGRELFNYIGTTLRSFT